MRRLHESRKGNAWLGGQPEFVAWSSGLGHQVSCNSCDSLELWHVKLLSDYCLSILAWRHLCRCRIWSCAVAWVLSSCLGRIAIGQPRACTPADFTSKKSFHSICVTQHSSGETLTIDSTANKLPRSNPSVQHKISLKLLQRSEVTNLIVS